MSDMTAISVGTRSMGFSTMGFPVTGFPATGAATATSPSGSEPRRSRLRLTRRGRVVLLALVTVPLAIVALVVTLNGGGATATDHSGTVHYVTVQAGESLWQVATEIAPSADPREVMAQLSDLNALGSGQVQPGQRLAIPSQYDR